MAILKPLPPNTTAVYLVMTPTWVRSLRRVLEAALRWTERFSTYRRVQ